MARRRQLLAGTAGLLGAGLAGCSAGDDGSASSQTSESDTSGNETTDAQESTATGSATASYLTVHEDVTYAERGRRAETRPLRSGD